MPELGQPDGEGAAFLSQPRQVVAPASPLKPYASVRNCVAAVLGLGILVEGAIYGLWRWRRRDSWQGVVSSTLGGATQVANLTRTETHYDWCSCGTGLSNVTFWPTDNGSQAITLRPGSVHWLQWPAGPRSVSWICDGMSSPKQSRWDSGSAWWSLQFHVQKETDCGEMTGRLRWNDWQRTDYPSSVPFTSHSEGYACFKIPYLLRTATGALIALAEARKPNCGDLDETLLVYKRSTDGGITWSGLRTLVEPEAGARTVCNGPLVVGNAAPVQLSVSSKRHPGRILVPHTRNNYDVWIVHSDDDGETWSAPRELPGVAMTDKQGPDCNRSMSYFGYMIDQPLGLFDIESNAKILKDFMKYILKLGWGKKDPYKSPRFRDKLTGPWQWVGVGPPGSLQLRSGRVLVPGYHSYVRGLKEEHSASMNSYMSQMYNNLAFAHVMFSDDDGDTWALGPDRSIGGGDEGNGANENQIVELLNGSLLMNSRSLSTGSLQRRLQARSDDGGATWTPTAFVPELPEPFQGATGSTVGSADGTVFHAHADPAEDFALLPHLAEALKARNVNLTGRTRMTVWKSADGGTSYPQKFLVDPGLTGLCSIQAYERNGSEPVVGLLYEQADPAPVEGLMDMLNDIMMGPVVILLPSRFIFREIPVSEIR